MSKAKEINFFAARDCEARLDEYRAHFPQTPGKTVYGESTPGYFWTYDADSPWCVRYSLGNHDIPGTVRRVLGPEVRLVASLRHPVDRAISGFFHHFRRGRLGAEARLAEIGGQFGLVDMGFYSRHLAAWKAPFGEAALLVLLFDRIAREPNLVLAEVYQHLGLPVPATSPEARAEHTGLRLRVHGDWLEIDPEDSATATLLDQWKRTFDEAPRVHADDIAMLCRVFEAEIRLWQERLADAAGADWVGRTQLKDFMTIR